MDIQEYIVAIRKNQIEHNYFDDITIIWTEENWKLFVDLIHTTHDGKVPNGIKYMGIIHKQDKRLKENKIKAGNGKGK
jgi:hypothetical protein